MIQLDRDGPLSVGDQLVEALRFEIGAGRYRPGERLPSTRALADQVGVSFHTVRKAYQRLAEEGVLDVRRGGGYHVVERPAMSRSERLERAAGVVEEALQKLVGLGLTEDEVEYAFGEGMHFFQRPDGQRTLLFAAGYRELAETGADQATSALQERVVPVLLAELARRPEADGVIVPLPDLRAARLALPNAEMVGVRVEYPHGVLETVARLVPPEALALVTRQADAVAPLADDLRTRTGFSGSTLGWPIDADRRQVEAAIRRATLVLYTPQARRRVRPLLQHHDRPGAELTPVLSAESLARIRTALGA